MIQDVHVPTRPAVASGNTTPTPTPTLERKLGVISAAAVVVGMIIGSGIFRVPATVAEQTGSWPWSLAIWTIGGIIALAGALCIAEMAAMDPRSGGVFVYIRETYGPLPAFLFGWTDFLIIRPGTMAAVGLIFASYMGAFLPLSMNEQRGVSAILTILLTAAHYRSVGWGAALQNLSSIAKALALLFVAVAIFLLGDPSQGAFASERTISTVSLARGGVALIAVMWAYDGWADVSAMAGEVKDPGRNLPRAIIGGMAVVLLSYVAINLAYFYTLPAGDVAKSTLVAADAVGPIFGRAGSSLIAALVMLATFGTANATVMTGSRFIYAMADDGLFFRRFAAVHPKFRTPHISVAGIGVLGVLYATSRTFEQLTAAIILGEWPFYMLAVGAVIVWRIRAPDRPRPFRAPLYPVLPIVFVGASLLLVVNALFTDTKLTMLSFGIIATGVPAYLMWQRYVRRGDRTRP
jgi:amino acid transporter